MDSGTGAADTHKQQNRQYAQRMMIFGQGRSIFYIDSINLSIGKGKYICKKNTKSEKWFKKIGNNYR